LSNAAVVHVCTRDHDVSQRPRLELPTSSARWVISYTPVLGGGYDSAPARLYSPVLWNSNAAP
jgi:hypothetical protein